MEIIKVIVFAVVLNLVASGVALALSYLRHRRRNKEMDKREEKALVGIERATRIIDANVYFKAPDGYEWKETTARNVTFTSRVLDEDFYEKFMSATREWITKLEEPDLPEHHNCKSLLIEEPTSLPPEFEEWISKHTEGDE